MPLPFFIGLSGKKQCGKDAVAKIIRCTLGARRVGFADALKEELAAACGCSADYIEENKAAFRVGLQWWGTEFRREMIRENYWVDQLVLATAGHKYWPIIVVPDVRFANEAQAILAAGGVIARVHRAENAKGSMLKAKVSEADASAFSLQSSAFVDAHASETALDHVVFGHNLDNSGTLDELEVRVLTWLERLRADNNGFREALLLATKLAARN